MPIQTVVEQNTLTVQCDSPSIEASEATACVKACAALDQGISLVVFDFSPARLVSDPAIETLIAFSKKIQVDEQRLVLLVQQDFADRVAASKAGDSLQCFVRSIRASREKIAPPPVSNNEQVLSFCRVLASAVVQTLEFYSSQKIASTPPRVLPAGQSEKQPQIDLAGLITIITPEFEGSMTLGFPRSTFTLLLPQKADGGSNRLHPSQMDWAAELLNVSFGHFKSALNGSGYEFHPAIPTVIQGAELELAHPKNTITAISELTFGAEKCFVLVSKVCES